MKRRDFIKSGLLSLTSPLTSHALRSEVLGERATEGKYEDGQKLTLGNRYLDWNLLLTAGTIRSVSLRNKLSGRDYPLGDSKEFQVTLSETSLRIEIPWWFVHVGPNNDNSSPEIEEGFLAGYHLVNFPGEEQWDKTLNLLLAKVTWGYWGIEAPPVFDGYCWFRQWFELPKTVEGSPIVFCLGGYTQEDWNQYWVFLNGKLIGNRKRSGRWRTPEELSLVPGTPDYAALRFGPEEKNLLGNSHLSG